MSGFLTDDWLSEAQAALGSVSVDFDGTAVVQYTVSGAPDGKVVLHLTIANGTIELGSGKASSPDVSLSLGYDDARSLITGERTADSVFMSGALKVEGDHKKWLLDLRPAREAALAALAPTLA